MIRPLPAPPSRNDALNFAPQANALLSALPGFVDDCNALEGTLQLVATTGTSTSTLTVGNGSKSLVTQPGKAWILGAMLYIVDPSAPANLMQGQLIAYNTETGALTVGVQAFSGSGSRSTWVIGLAGIGTAGLGANTFTAPQTLPGNASGPLEAVPKQQLDASVAIAAPPGALMAFAMNVAPSGWLRCDGTAVSRTTYASLFAAIGTLYGPGNGATTFNLPELRGEFLRGHDAGRGVDVGRVIGSTQAGEIATHNHTIKRVGPGVGAGGTPAVIYADSGRDSGTYQSEYGDSTGPINTSGGTETRPRNVAVLYCIKT